MRADERAPATGARPDTAAAKVTESLSSLRTQTGREPLYADSERERQFRSWQQGLHRRAWAARRLPVLDSGVRDPQYPEWK